MLGLFALFLKLWTKAIILLQGRIEQNFMPSRYGRLLPNRVQVLVVPTEHYTTKLVVQSGIQKT
jgi:hypothetical protein